MYWFEKDRKDMKIVSAESAAYVKKRGTDGPAVWNGAFYYSKEIVRNIIPNVETDRSWITINLPELGAEDGAIVFIHNNKTPEVYNWLNRYRDLILVCGIPETVERVKGLGHAVYLPLSIDTKDVKAHSGKKTRGRAYVGRQSKHAGIKFPNGTDLLQGMPRDRLLDEVARYREVYAVGRCAIEAKALGCKILPYDPRFPDPKIWKVVDNLDAAKKLQEILDEIDGGRK